MLSAAIEGMFLNTELFGHQRGASNKGYKRIEYGTLVLSTQNLHLGNANVNLRFEHGMVSPAYKTYRIKNCSVTLLAEWIKSEKAKQFFYDATTVGASVCRRNVEWETLYDQTLYLPTHNEQQHIAEFLSLVSERILRQEKFIECLKKYKRGVDASFFDIKRQHCEKKLYGWDCVPFGDVVAINPKTPALPERFIYIDLESVDFGRLQCLKYINRKDAPSRAQRVLADSDVLFQMVRPYQKNNYFFQDVFDSPVVASTGYAQIRCPDCDPVFVFEQISSDYFSQEAMLRSTGTGYPAINSEGLAEIPFFLPSLPEQKKIGKFLSLLRTKIENENRKLEVLNKLKTALLQQLFI